MEEGPAAEEGSAALVFLAWVATAERAAAGVDRLDAVEKSRLDLFVSQEIAAGPPPGEAFRYVPPAADMPPLR